MTRKRPQHLVLVDPLEVVLLVDVGASEAAHLMHRLCQQLGEAQTHLLLHTRQPLVDLLVLQHHWSAELHL